MIPHRRLLWMVPATSFAALLSFAAPASSQGNSGQGKTDSKPASRPGSESRPAGDHKALAIGDPAPAFSVKDQTGKLRTLAEFKGKRVMLYFYPKADTPG